MENELTWTPDVARLDSLELWARNPKRMSKTRAARLRNSWKDLKQYETLAVGPSGEVYNGHQRVKMLTAAGYPGDLEIYVLRSNRPLTDTERERVIIESTVGTVGALDFDALAGWDNTALQTFGLDAEALAEWNDAAANLREMLTVESATAVDAEPQMDRAAELLEKWGVQSGDVWEVESRHGGVHRLVCGDCTDKAVVDKVMQGEKAGAVVTDPPYGINREGIQNDDPEGLRALFDGCLATMPIDDGVLIAFQSPRLEWVWLDAIRNAGWHPERILWMYRTGQAAYPWRGWYMRSDVIRVASIGSPEWPNRPDAATDCYTVNINDTETVKATNVGGMSLHSTIKPIDVVQDLVQHTTGIVYDPFLGSGTCIVACENLGRKGRGIEISPAYVSVTLERLSVAFGITPVRLG